MTFFGNGINIFWTRTLVDESLTKSAVRLSITHRISFSASEFHSWLAGTSRILEVLVPRAGIQVFLSPR